MLRWVPEDDAISYNVYSGTLSQLASGDYGECYRSGLSVPEVVIGESPAPEECLFFVLGVVDLFGEGSVGADSNGAERVIDQPCR